MTKVQVRLETTVGAASKVVLGTDKAVARSFHHQSDK